LASVFYLHRLELTFLKETECWSAQGSDSIW
jgi:hypothetical protein